MGLEAFSAQSEYYRRKIQQGHTQGAQGMAALTGASMGLGASSLGGIFAEDMGFLNGFHSAARGALRDGTGKEVKHPKSFIEELQAETDEWLKGAI